jgi:hypothetical protein
MVERRSELNRRYHRKKKMAKLKARLAEAKSNSERETILKKIRILSPWRQEPVRPPTSPPPAPTNLRATPGDAQVRLNWTAADGAASYNIYRGTNAATVATTPIRTGVTGTTFADTGLTNGTPYVYTVTAVNLGGQSAHSNMASATPQPARWGLREAEVQIDIWLRERGFGNRSSHLDYTCWSGDSVFWQASQGDLWCLASFPNGDLRFGVYPALLREAVSDWLGPEGTIQDFISLARLNPDFPDEIRLIQRQFDMEDREYWGVQIGPRCGPPKVYALIAELVNAFVIRVTSPGQDPWPPSSGIRKPEPGVLNIKTKPMPDPELSPYHGFIINLAEHIDSRLQPHDYGQTINVGSYSWTGPSGAAGRHVVGWKLCYHGSHDWRFGWRRELEEDNACLRQRRYYDFRFHVPPDANAVFHGFRVYDTLASHARVGAVLDCLGD